MQQHDPRTCETCQQVRQLEIERLERRRAFYAAATKERRWWPRFQAWLAQFGRMTNGM